VSEPCEKGLPVRGLIIAVTTIASTAATKAAAEGAGSGALAHGGAQLADGALLDLADPLRAEADPLAQLAQ
jgi:hypothetical protein